MSLPANLTHTRRSGDTYSLTFSVSGLDLTGKDLKLYVVGGALDLTLTGTVNDSSSVSFAPPIALHQAAVGSYPMRLVHEPNSTTERRTLAEGLWIVQ